MKRIHIGRTATMLFVGILFSMWSPPMAPAFHEVFPAAIQITTNASQTVGGPAFGSPNLPILLFHSDADLLGNGNTTPQIFLWNGAQYYLSRRRPLTKFLYQLTTGQGSFEPAAAQRGRILAFHSTADHLGNGSVGRQIFAARKVRYTKNQVPLFQVTNGHGGGESYDVVMSGTGRYIVFTSTRDLTSANLPPGPHLYRVDLMRFTKSQCSGYPCALGVNPGLTLLTKEVASNPRINMTGNLVIFDSRADVTGAGCSNGASQLFLWKAPGTIEQLTTGSGDSQHGNFTFDGTKIFFDSAADLAQTGNARANIFSMDYTSTSRNYTQRTFGTDGDSTRPELAGATGDHVYFFSTASLTGSAPGTNRLYLLQQGFTPPLVRLTADQNLLSDVAAAGWFVGVASDGDGIGNANTLPQMFMLNAFRAVGNLIPPPVSTPVPTSTPTVTPTAKPTPVVSEPDNIDLALMVNEASDNGNNTLTTMIAAVVGDFYGNPVPDGTHVNFSAVPDTAGLVVSNGSTNTDPECDVAGFVAKTGVPIHNRPGVVHVCVTYAGALAGTQRTIFATAGPKACQGGTNAFGLCSVDADCPPHVICSNAPHACTTDSECPNGACVNQHDASCEPAQRCVGGYNDHGICFVGADCPPIALCSNSSTVCNLDAECPGGTCVQHPGSCEPTALGWGEFRLPLGHNECTQVDQPCSDYNPCTISDTCIANPTTTGACFGGTNDGGVCTTNNQCPDRRECVGGANTGTACTNPSDCPDLKVCEGGINSGAWCTSDVDCFQGSCAVRSPGSCVLMSDGICDLPDPIICQPGAALSCPDDGNPCTQDTCYFLSGQCGTPVHCPADGNPCTDDVCDPGTGGCLHAPNTDPCDDDGNPCTDDVCDGLTGTCGVPNSAPCADDGNPCTDSFCDGLTGRCGTPNDANPCEDGDLCTTPDFCLGGLCQSGPALVCPDDGNPCTEDVCNAAGGTCGVPQACTCP